MVIVASTHGYVVSVAVSGAGPLGSYQVPTQREGAVWETNGAVVSPQGDLYVATGNGSSSNPAHFDEGDSVVELSPSLKRISYWAPGNWLALNDHDWTWVRPARSTCRGRRFCSLPESRPRAATPGTS